MIERRAWRFSDGVILTGLLVLALFATLSIWREIFSISIHDEEQSHVLLAPAIALWLAWVRRERLRYCRPKWTILGPVAIAAGWASALYGFNSSHEIFWHFGAILIIAGAAFTILGTDFLRNFLPVFVALIFLLPVPAMLRQQIAIPLQEATARVTTFILELFAVPIMRDGNLLSINGTQVAVAEACNGMRMVAALGLISFAFIFSVPMRMSVRLFILAISPLVAILCNVIRLVPTVLLYGYADIDTAQAFHDISGWVMLPVALGILWGAFALLRWIEVPILPYAVAEEYST